MGASLIKMNITENFPEIELGKDKILGIGGSPRSGGNSDVLLKHILKGAEKEGVPTELVQLRNYDFKSCIGCEKCRKDRICTGLNDGMTLLYPKYIEARGLVLVSPSHWYFVSAMMKSFIDRLYCLFQFPAGRNYIGKEYGCSTGHHKRKMVGAMVCEQPTPEGIGYSWESMGLWMRDLETEIVYKLAVGSSFAVGEVKKNTAALEKAEAMGSKLARAIKSDPL